MRGIEMIISLIITVWLI